MNARLRRILACQSVANRVSVFESDALADVARKISSDVKVMSLDVAREQATRDEERPSAPLPRQSSNNSIGELPAASAGVQSFGTRKLLLAGNGYWLRAAVTLEAKIAGMASDYGLEHLGFFTLTFADDLQWTNEADWREAMRRWDSFNSNVVRRLFLAWVCVAEPQDSGRIHFHLVVVCHEDIRTGTDWKLLKRKKWWRATNENLHALWRELNPKYGGCLGRYGFGRAELLPVRTDQHAIANYVGGYLVKAFQNNENWQHRFKARKVRASKSCQKYSSMVWRWRGGKDAEWRAKLKMFCEMVGVSFDELPDVFGKKWAYHLREHVRTLNVSVVQSCKREVEVWRNANRLGAYGVEGFGRGIVSDTYAGAWEIGESEVAAGFVRSESHSTPLFEADRLKRGHVLMESLPDGSFRDVPLPYSLRDAIREARRYVRLSLRGCDAGEDGEEFPGAIQLSVFGESENVKGSDDETC